MKYIIVILCCATTSFSFGQQKITLEDAAKHVGDSVSVCGKVYGGIYLQKSKRQPTMLNVGAAYPNNPFTAVIFDKARALFTNAPEVYYKDSNVCITGRVALYNGKPQIVVNSPEQLTIQNNLKP